MCVHCWDNEMWTVNIILIEKKYSIQLEIWVDHSIQHATNPPLGSNSKVISLYLSPLFREKPNFAEFTISNYQLIANCKIWFFSKQGREIKGDNLWIRPQRGVCLHAESNGQLRFLAGWNIFSRSILCSLFTSHYLNNEHT